MIKWVIFDLGGVLVQIRREWDACARAAGYPALEEDLQNTPEITKLYGIYQSGRLTLSELCEKLASLMNHRYTPTDILRIHHAILKGEYPGVGEVVQRVLQGGTSTAILSNTCKEHWSVLQTYPAIAQIKRVFTSYELGLIKPDPGIYQRVQNDLHAHPSGILFFDDSPENIEAAQKEGWRAELIDPHRDPAGQLQAHLKRYRLGSA